MRGAQRKKQEEIQAERMNRAEQKYSTKPSRMCIAHFLLCASIFSSHICRTSQMNESLMHMYNYCKTCSARADANRLAAAVHVHRIYSNLCNEITNCHQIVDIDIIAKKDPMFVAMKCVSPGDMSFRSASLVGSDQGYFDVHFSLFSKKKKWSGVAEMCSITPQNHDSCPVLMWSSARATLHAFHFTCSGL